MARRKTKPTTVTDQLRLAIENCGLTRYEIWKLTGVDQGALSRFVYRKQSLTLDIVDKLADTLGLTLVTDTSKWKER